MVLLTAGTEFSPGLTVVLTSIFLVFVFSVWFMYRIGMEQMGAVRSGVVVNFTAPSQAMGQVYNPYVLEMTDKATATLADGAAFSLTTQFPCELRTYWGVNIKDIFPAVHQPWSQFSRQIEEGILLHGSCLATQDVTHFEVCENHQIHLAPPAGDGGSFQLGPRPRARYPLVMVITPPGSATSQEEVEENQIVCVVLIVHLKDEVCPVESHLIAHYVRTATGQPHNLQQLYVATDEAPQESASSSTDPGTTTQPPEPPQAFCVICQSSPVTRVILPCRHACVCRRCFPRLQNCPMCRGYINSYFSMEGEEEGDGDADAEAEYEVDESMPVQGEHWWMRVNDRLNQFFGLR